MFWPPQDSLTLPLQGEWQRAMLSPRETCVALDIELSQKHCVAYSTPAMEYPLLTQMEMQLSTVSVVESGS